VLGGLGVRSVRLMTNNPRKVEALEGLGVAVAERVPLLAGWNQHKRPGLSVSSDKLGCLTEFIPGRLDTLLVTALQRDNQDGNPATIRMRMRRCWGDEGRA
jgi:hypothetical protein